MNTTKLPALPGTVPVKCSPVEIRDYANITQTLIVYCKTAEVPGMGPGKRVTVARVASRYSVLWLPEDLGFQTGLWIPRWTPWDGVTAAFILLVYDIHGDVSPCMPSTRNSV